MILDDSMMKTISSIVVEAKSYKLTSKYSDHDYDPNPIHQMVIVQSKQADYLLAINSGYTLHVLVFRGTRLYLLESKQVNNAYNGVISGIKSIGKVAYLFGWRQYLRKIEF